jgi:hypothetical protein
MALSSRNVRQGEEREKREGVDKQEDERETGRKSERKSRERR